MYNHHGILYGSSTKKFKIKLLDDSAITFLGMYLKEIKSLEEYLPSYAFCGITQKLRYGKI